MAFIFSSCTATRRLWNRLPLGILIPPGAGRNHVTHPSQFVLTNGQIRLWYMGEDGSPPHFQRIGLMEAAIP